MDFRDELFDDDDDLGFDDDGFDFGDEGELPDGVGQVIGGDDEFSDFDDTGSGGGGDGRFLGMTSGERAFLSVMFFLNVVVLCVAALMATGRISL